MCVCVSQSKEKNIKGLSYIVIIIVVKQESVGKERKMVDFILNTFILFEILKGELYNLNN